MDSDSIYDLHEYGIDYENREIWLTPEPNLVSGLAEEGEETGVEWVMASKFLKNLRTLEQHKYNEPILIHLKTNGGMWEEGMAIYDAIKHCPCPVTILNYTHARSMSSLIFLAGDLRVMMPNSVFMYHDGTFSFGGTIKQLNTEYAQSVKTGDKMLSIYSEAMREHSSLWRNKTDRECKEYLRSHMDKKEEVYLSPQEAIKHGFADEVFDGDWEGLTDYEL